MKQKSWWEENAPDRLYDHDYYVALIIHSFSWAFMINIPVFIYFKFDPPAIVYTCFKSNLCIHFLVDNLKANLKYINLIVDQTLHLLQIVLTFSIIFLDYYFK